MNRCSTLLPLFVAMSLCFAPAPTMADTRSPFDDGTTEVGQPTSSGGSSTGAGVSPTSVAEPTSGQVQWPTPPDLNPPPAPGSKGVSTASAQFKAWLEKARVHINKWNFPEGVVNKYGKTITRDDYLKAIIWIESNGVHKSPRGTVTTSYVGAKGFMQLMPATAKGLGYNATDPQQNLLAGCKYLTELFDCDGVTMATTPQEKLIKACCAYNAGPYSSFVQRTWDKLKMGKNYETIGYGLKMKMCLGLELTPTEKTLVTKVFDCKMSKVDSLVNEFYSNANGLF